MKLADVIMAAVMVIDVIMAISTSSREIGMNAVEWILIFICKSNKLRRPSGGAWMFQPDHSVIIKSCSVRFYHFTVMTPRFTPIAQVIL